MENQLTAAEKQFLQQAKRFLEQPGWAIRLTEKVGRPVEWAIDRLPELVRKRIESAAQTGIEHAFTVALKTISLPTHPTNHDVLLGQFDQQLKSAHKDRLAHDLLLGGTGMIGGFLGTAGTIIEIPISTSLMMRDMLRVGSSFGIHDPGVLITEALYLFSYGAENPDDDAVNSAYFSSRLGFQELIRESGQFIAQQGTKALLEAIQKGNAPILVRLMSKIATRFNLPLTEKVLAQAMPVMGAIGGATINSIFADYYHNISYYHFGIKNLEQRYGDELIRQNYQTLLTTDKG